jgi:ABC-type sugar transport system ATPase subunit
MIQAEGLCIQAGDFRLEDLSFHVPQGAYCALMGRTGSGKTTLLESICGLKPIAGGRLLLDDRDACKLKPAARGIGLVPQDGALFYTMTVRQHLEFALRIRRWNKADIARRIGELAELIELEPLLDRRPRGLSGGERQRVALGRALAFRPRILCMDEPISALDDESRQHLVRLLKRVQQDTGVTALHVTHNRQEAEQLADLHLHIVDGRIEQSQPV